MGVPSFVRLVVAVALLSAISFAQDNSGSGPSQAEQAAKEQRGLAALHEAIAQSQNLNLTVNKIYLESSAAVLLWTRDEPLARSLVSNVRAHYKELAAQAGTDRARDQLAQQAFSFRH